MIHAGAGIAGGYEALSGRQIGNGMFTNALFGASSITGGYTNFGTEQHGYVGPGLQMATGGLSIVASMSGDRQMADALRVASITSSVWSLGNSAKGFAAYANQFWSSRNAPGGQYEPAETYIVSGSGSGEGSSTESGGGQFSVPSGPVPRNPVQLMGIEVDEGLARGSEDPWSMYFGARGITAQGQLGADDFALYSSVEVNLGNPDDDWILNFNDWVDPPGYGDTWVEDAMRTVDAKLLFKEAFGGFLNAFAEDYSGKVQQMRDKFDPGVMALEFGRNVSGWGDEGARGLEHWAANSGYDGEWTQGTIAFGAHLGIRTPLVSARSEMPFARESLSKTWSPVIED